MIKVRYRRYFSEGEAEVRSIAEAIHFIDSDQHYATSVELDSGQVIEVDPSPFDGGPTALIKKLRELDANSA